MTEDATKSANETAKEIERLQELEIKFAFQQETIEALNAAVTKQWTEIDRLKSLIGLLQNEMAELGEASGDPGNVKPPHY